MVVVVAALFLGLLVIAFLSRFAHNVPRVDIRSEGEKTDERPPIPPAEFEQIIRALVRGLRLDVVSMSTEENGTVEMTCLDPRPVTGGRLLVRASRATAGGQVDAAEVLAFAESVRGDMGALKGIDIAVAGFTDEAYAAAGSSSARVELIDGPKLVESHSRARTRARRASRTLPNPSAEAGAATVAPRGPPRPTSLGCFRTDRVVVLEPRNPDVLRGRWAMTRLGKL